MKIIDKAVPRRYLRPVNLCVICACFVFLIGTSWVGVRRTIRTATVPLDDDMISYVKTHAAPGQVYLTMGHDGFRLASGAAIFVDKKTHPYRDIDVIDWYDRIQLANAFYQTSNGVAAAEALDAIRKISPITHVLVYIHQRHLLDSLDGRIVFQEQNRVLLQLHEEDVHRP